MASGHPDFPLWKPVIVTPRAQTLPGDVLILSRTSPEGSVNSLEGSLSESLVNSSLWPEGQPSDFRVLKGARYIDGFWALGLNVKQASLKRLLLEKKNVYRF